jgi:2-amino-4-hydroxy-6-hydroxymethyldihydropteridine diphosphokinase
MATTITAFIGLGSNLGDGKRTLQAAWEQLGRLQGVRLCALSHPYGTAPVDMESSNWFTNAVGKIETTLSVEELLGSLLALETAFGRTRDYDKTGYQDRSLDLDILCFGDKVVDSPNLTLPHPRMAHRLFVLVPFAEIAPDHRNSPNGLTIGEQCAQLLEHIGSGRNTQQELNRQTWED